MVLVIGGIKGGTGKSTLAFHLASYMAQLGKRFMTVDMDHPQLTFTRYYVNRKNEAKLNSSISLWDNHQTAKSFCDILRGDEDFCLIDTPGRLDENTLEAHKMADVIITPINDSFIDLDTIMEMEGENWSRPSHYAGLIFENKKAKSGGRWIVVRNRMSGISSKYKRLLGDKLQDLSRRLNFTLAHGVGERVIFKELFQKGLTVMDIPDKKLSVSHVSARMEVKMLWKEVGNAL